MAARSQPVRTSPRGSVRRTPAPPARGLPGRISRRRLLPGAIVLAALAAAAGLALSLLGTGGSASAAPPAPPISPVSMTSVETVDGQALPVREYELFLAQDRAETFAYFQDHYGAADSADFWTTAHGGQTPAGYLEHAALADATRALEQQVLANKYAVTRGFTYVTFLSDWQAQNASRASAIAANQAIYGPTHYSESDYYTYISGETAQQLQTALVGKGAIKVTESALKQYYSAHLSRFAAGAANADQNVGTKAQGPSAVDNGPMPFAQAESEVRQYYIQDAYTALLTTATAQAVVHVDTNVLAEIAIA